MTFKPLNYNQEGFKNFVAHAYLFLIMLSLLVVAVNLIYLGFALIQIVQALVHLKQSCARVQLKVT